MPNYRFKCLDCGHKFEKLLPVGHPEQKCLECGHPETEKLLTAPGVQFKSGGFYKTDSQVKSGGSGGSNSGRKEQKTEVAPVVKEKSDSPKGDDKKVE